MSEKNIEQHLSAMMDDECGASEARFILKRYSQCAETRARWSRFHVAREVLHGSHLRIEAMTLTERVSDALKNEAAPERQSMAPRWLRPVAGVAVAASVAAVAVMLTQPATQDQAELAVPNSLVSLPTVEQPVTTLPATNGRRPQAQLASATNRSAMEDPRLREYVLRHNRVAPNARSGFTQYVYFVTRPAEQAEQATAEPKQEGTP